MTNDEYTEDTHIIKCIIKKSTSVTKNLFHELALPVSIVIIGIAFLFILNAIAIASYNSIANSWAFITTLNPMVYIVIVLALPVPTYSTIWCVRHRREAREKKAMMDNPICPIDEKKV